MKKILLSVVVMVMIVSSFASEANAGVSGGPWGKRLVETTVEKILK